ncbi:MAG: hypothetical protein LQ340_003720 [Diploschistes diacapsis]|nr:MAG: hypothetical protein LQ340_003720 [Diploschistes diacapsis]
MSRRTITTVGLIGAAGVGYYFYSAGGDPKVAQKMAERDASRVSGGGKEAQKQGEEWASRAGKSVDKGVADAKALGKDYEKQLNKTVGDVESKLSHLKSDAASKFEGARKDSKQEIDNFDKTVERKTAEAKSGVSSWFGSSK